MLNASVVGASGYSGGELVRLLTSHPGVELGTVTANQQQGQRLDHSFPSLRAFTEATLEAPDWRRLGASSDVVFLALPHGLSMSAVPELRQGGARVVDLGADFRLRDTDAYTRWYGLEHTATALLGEAVYGLPELHREKIRAADLVACPGCYPTAATLALLPALAFREEGAPIIVDAKSGVSGAGRGASLGTLFSEVNENVKPYNLGIHRHTPEMGQNFADAGAAEGVFFSPHLIPMTRGILATCYLRTSRAVSREEAMATYVERYADCPFVRVLGDKLPETKATQSSNFCDVSVAVDAEKKLIVGLAALDNLVKGAAGQAIQCMNLMFGLPEEEGLWQPPLFP